MMRIEPPRILGILGLLGLPLAGCEVTMELPAAHPPNPPAGAPAQIAPGAAKGEPPGLAPRQGVGLWIWQGDDGIWRLRSTTDGHKRVFRGRIVGQSSAIGWLRSELLEAGDALSHSSGEIIFKFETSGHMDGIDFVPDDRGCVVFHVTVDEAAQPALVRLGAGGSTPPSDYFALCP